ncbi:uncharacterized protein METZ01_LOCUS281066, partial [marine metagenome]
VAWPDVRPRFTWRAQGYVCACWKCDLFA